MARPLFETLETLVKMKQEIGGPSLRELRNGSTPDAHSRIEKIHSTWPNDSERGISSVGGNSNIYFFNQDGRREEQFIHNGEAWGHYLHRRDSGLTVAIYPYGIAGQTEAGQPIFENPETSSRVSVVLELELEPLPSVPWLQRRVEPLFNIDADGSTLAGTNSQPTPAELELLDEILQQFEAAS